MGGDQLIYLFWFIIVQVEPMIEVIKLWLDVIHVAYQDIEQQEY
jgi:hypothetical protein